MTAIKQFVVKDADTIRDDIARTIRNGMVEFGIVNPNVGPNSDFILSATALGNQLAVVGANCIVATDNQMPDTGDFDGLNRWGDIFDNPPQPASGSLGSFIIVCSANAPVPTGAQLTDTAGLRYRVTTGGSYVDGTAVPIEAVDVGAATNHDEGDTLQWATTPPYCQDRVLVAKGGLTNGIDAEDVETYRARILDRFQTPTGSGNWAYLAAQAEKSTPSVQKAFVYPAVQGPATVDLAVVAAPTTTEKSRQVQGPLVTGTVYPFTRGKVPEHPNITLTTVTDVEVDVAFALVLPEAPTANPPGDGGGWLNGTPWPRPDTISDFKCTVTAVTTTTQFTVDSQAEPTQGVTRIAWLSPLTWLLYTALVTSYTGSAGAWVITIDEPFVDIMTGAFIWPECENAQAYCDTMLDAFKSMGPGEKTANISVFGRGFRHPPPSTSWPMALGGHQTSALTADTFPEVASATWLYRHSAVATINGGIGQMVPAVPALVASPPNQFIPRHVGFYRQP